MMCPRLLSLFLTATPLASSAEVVLRGNNILVDHQLEANQDNKEISQTLLPDPVGDDLILFNNGDLMHGEFAGIEETGLIWKRNDIERNIKFSTPSIKQIIFESSRRLKFNERSSFITLVSGDRIPGQIISLDDKNLSIKSPITGELSLPRNLIRAITPNPFDGEIHYLGPYNSDGWLTLETIEEEKKKDEAEADEKNAEEEAPSKTKPSSWIHSGTSFFSQTQSPLILADAMLPDSGRVRFNVSWKGTLSLGMALHADLTRVTPPEKEEKEEEAKAEPLEEEEKMEEEPEKEPEPLLSEKLLDLRKGTSFQSIPWLKTASRSFAHTYGTCYTLSLQSGYPYLSRNSFNEEGSAVSTRLTTDRSVNSLRQANEAEIELRFDRKKALIILYINGVYSNQWNDVLGYHASGSALGFFNQSSTSNLRISELVISSWAGATDSAQSMEHPERDIVLLTNETDRYSGKISTISEGIATLETNYSNIQVPLKDLSLINFGSANLLDLKAEENTERFTMKDDALTVIYQPFGLIKLSPTSADQNSLTGHSPFLGEISLNLDPALLIRFSDDSPDLSDWFDDF